MLEWPSYLSSTDGNLRTLAEHCKDEEERQRYTERWKAAHDMMSIAGCLTAFHEVNEKGAFPGFLLLFLRIVKLTQGAEALWQLIKMASWLTEFLKKLLKACVLATSVAAERSQGAADDLFGSTPSQPLHFPLPSVAHWHLDSPVAKEQLDPVLINLAHPFALEALSSVLRSMQRLKDLVDRNALPDEISAIGRDVIDDLVDTCPAQIPELIKVLSEAKNEATKLDGALYALSCGTQLADPYSSKRPQ